MNTELIQEIKERLLEYDPCIELLDEHEDKLIGYAERFGCQFIPLYKGVNTFLCKNHKKAVEAATKLSDRVCNFDGLESSCIGYVILDDGQVALLHDKEKLIEELAKEYEESDMEIDEDDSYYSQALQWYDYNIIGTGLSELTTPAFALDTEEFPITN